MFDANDSSMDGIVIHIYGFQMVNRSRHQTLLIVTMHSKMEIEKER